MTLILIALGAFTATMLGGLFALRFKDKLHLILGFSAGAVIAVAFFDLLPEALNLIGPENSRLATTIVAIGFVVYMILDRLVITHSHHHEEHAHHTEGRAKLGAGSLSTHSFLDGLAIGLAFQVSAAVGAVVAVAVLVHDFSDGINTVNMVLKNTGDKLVARKWLLVDALAPVAGIVVGSLLTFNEHTLGLILSLFAGFFLYIGASDLLPESHHNHPTWWTTFATILGVVVLYVAIQVAG